ncbi:MAG: phosphoribosyltransferase [Acidimicrobiales bacterium]
MERRPPLWSDRREAGVELAARLRDGLPGDGRAIVLGLPRGGVVVAAEVARVLDADLDALVVCKVGVPWHPELALGAVGGTGVRVRNDDVVRHTGLTEPQLDQAFTAAEGQVARREQILRAGRPPPELAGRPVIIVDDGLATGATALAAAQIVRALSATVVVLAVPVAPADTDPRLAAAVDAFVALARPRRFGAVGTWYEDFRQVEDDDVRALLGT